MPLFARSQRAPRKTPRLIPVAAKATLGFDYVIRLSSRKSAVIEIKAEEVRVYAPHRATQKALKQWVEENAPWIRQKLRLQAQRRQQIPTRGYTEGAPWPFMGERLKLRITTGNKSDTVKRDQELIIQLSRRSQKPQDQQVKLALQEWYKQQALKRLTEKSRYWCQQLNTQYRSIKLRRTKSKWGHCTIQGDLQFNWLILQAPEAVIDYLVVHECCHLIEHNHSRRFWTLVEQLLPDYRQHKQWLREHGHQLLL